MRSLGVSDARSWAKNMHVGQTRIGGETYVTHLERVARLVEIAGGDEELIQIAWLHDIVEDTPCTFGHLRHAGFSERVVKMVDALSRRPSDINGTGGETYWEYLERVKLYPDAVFVKRADLIDNMHDDVTRRGMWKRYEKSLRIIAPDLFE